MPGECIHPRVKTRQDFILREISISKKQWESQRICPKKEERKSNRERERQRGRERGNSTFTEFGPELSYDIFHQKGATLPVAAHMFLGWLLTEREGACVRRWKKKCSWSCVCLCDIRAARQQDDRETGEASSKLLEWSSLKWWWLAESCPHPPPLLPECLFGRLTNIKMGRLC